MATKLESLVVDLQVNTAALRAGLDEANRKLEGFGAKLKTLGGHAAEIGHAVAFHIGKEAVEALGEFVLKGAEFQDHMIKAARSAGEGVVEFSKLAFAFRLGGVDSEGLAKAFKTLNVNMTEAATGGAKQTALFKAFGVAVTDANGQLRSSGDVMADLADRFAAMEDGPAKSALAVELFGKAGAKMITALNGGSAGLRKAGEEAQRFGVVVTEQAGKSAEEFVDNLGRLHAASEGLSAQLAANLAPILEKFTHELLGSQEGADLLKGAVIGLTGVFKLLLSAGVLVGAAFEVVGKTIARAASIIADAADGRFNEAANAALNFTTTLAVDVVEASKSAGKHLEAIWDPKKTEEGAEAVRRISGKTAQQIVADAKRAEKAAEGYKTAMKALRDQLSAMRDQNADFGANSLEVMERRLTSGDLSKELAKIGKGAELIADNFRMAAKEAKDLADTKLADSLSFEAMRSGTTVEHQQGEKRAAFANVTASPGKIFEQLTAGFASFDAALKESADQQALATSHLNAAKQFEADKNYEGARSETLLADAAEYAAKRADAAGDAFMGLAVETKKAFDDAGDTLRAAAAEAAQKLQAAVMNGVSKLNSMLGDAGATVNAGLQGFTSGGIWGAVIAIVLELLSKFRRWGEVLDRAQQSWDKLLADLDGGLGGIVDALLMLMNAVQPLANLIHGVLNPILGIVGTLLGGIADTIGTLITILAPVFEIVGTALSGIGDLLKDLFEPLHAIGDVLKPILKLFGDLGKVLVPLAPIFAIIGFVLKLVALVILAIMNAIGTIINAIAKAFGATSDVVDTTTMQNQMADIATHLGDGFDPNKGKTNLSTSGTGKVPQAPGVAGNGVTYAMSEAEWTASHAQGYSPGEKSYQAYLETLPGYVKPFANSLSDATKTIQKFNEQFANVPSGYKIALARFNATRADASGMTNSSRDMGGVIMHGVNIYITATGGMTSEELLAKLTKASERKQFQATGSTQRFDPSHP